jgi:ADP-ribose pyrophosphatase YjhB (NUDIX family)
MTTENVVAADGQWLAIRSNDQDWAVSWHPPPTPPDGIPHGAEGLCVTGDGKVVWISEDGERWSFPAGRPEGTESWEETLRREMLEEACATVVGARLLGFVRGECVEGRELGLILVRSMWRADVALGPWEPRFEIQHRRVVTATGAAMRRMIEIHPFAAIIRRTVDEAAIT